MVQRREMSDRRAKSYFSTERLNRILHFLCWFLSLVPAVVLKGVSSFSVSLQGKVCSRRSSTCRRRFHSPWVKRRSRSVIEPLLLAQNDPDVALGSERNGVTFLGKNEDAIVRLGSVLLAPRYEFHHYYRKAAIYIYAMGEDENDVFVVRGLILDHPTPFTLKDLVVQNESESDGNNPLMGTSIFRGGDKGGEGVILLHKKSGIEGASEVENGIFTGGWDAALEACRDGRASSEDFKVFFNYCEFTEAELENMLKESSSTEEEGDDGWIAVEVDPDLVLNANYDRGDAWARFRNAVTQMKSSS